MRTLTRFKTALLAGAALAAATGAVAHAADRTPLEPIAVELEHAIEVADHGDAEKSQATHPVKGWVIYAAGAAMLAAIARLIGFRRIKAATKAVGAAAGKAAQAGAKAAGDVGVLAAKALASPLRLAMLAAGLVLIGLAGIDYYNLEWAAGLVFGALMSIAALRGARKVRRAPARR
jgi:hypothetical protein